MQRFLTHLTLIAYLVGGWLLPAAHHHASQVETHSHAVGGSCCDSLAHQHLQLVLSECEPAHACGCEHDAAEHPTDADAFIEQSRTHSHHCAALCAGCVAQSLVASQITDQAAWSFDVDAKSGVLAESCWLPAERYCFALSRGPPAAV